MLFIMLFIIYLLKLFSKTGNAISRLNFLKSFVFKDVNNNNKLGNYFRRQQRRICGGY
jgi:hypothetical protein